MKKANKILAINHIDNLISNDSDNPYLSQLKGEILLAFGDSEAINQYKTAMSLSNDSLIKIELAIAKIKI